MNKILLAYDGTAEAEAALANVVVVRPPRPESGAS